jgi:hypothetical protein
MTKDDIQENTIITDGGQKLSGIKDRNACTIIALATAAGIPYKEAFQIGKNAGRKTGCGFYTNRLMKEAKKNGIELKKLKYKSITLQKFLSLGKVGRFVVKRNGHAFAIIGNMIHDVIINPPMSRLVEIYEVKSNRIETFKSCLGK